MATIKEFFCAVCDAHMHICMQSLCLSPDVTNSINVTYMNLLISVK
jgi:hypothetical protein